MDDLLPRLKILHSQKDVRYHISGLTQSTGDNDENDKNDDSNYNSINDNDESQQGCVVAFLKKICHIPGCKSSFMQMLAPNIWHAEFVDSIVKLTSVTSTNLKTFFVSKLSLQIPFDEKFGGGLITTCFSCFLVRMQSDYNHNKHLSKINNLSYIT